MSHQDRREPLPEDYQFPTHGVDCDCPPCRNRSQRYAYDSFMSVDYLVNKEMTDFIYELIRSKSKLWSSSWPDDGYGFGV